MAVHPEGPNPDFIKSLFSSISDGYDRANDLMTFGVARKWRKTLVRRSEAKIGDHILDCATGTGDLAIAFKEVVGSQGVVIGTDFCVKMLDRASEKVRNLDLDIEFSEGDVMALGYQDDFFDITSIAFGIRNVQDPIKALREMARVTRSGGRVMILETGNNQTPIFGLIIRIYFQFAVPLIGGLVTKKRQAYEYLNHSSNHFPSNENFLQLMKESGTFSKIDCQALLGGASYLYTGLVE